MNIDKDALRKAAEAATMGPWDFDTAMTPNRVQGGEHTGGDALPWGDVYTCYDVDGFDSDGDAVTEPKTICDEISVVNGRFIAEANPATVIALLDEIAALVADKSNLERELKRHLSGEMDETLDLLLTEKADLIKVLKNATILLLAAGYTKNALLAVGAFSQLADPDAVPGA